jgi:hypothetical protein
MSVTLFRGIVVAPLWQAGRLRGAAAVGMP